MNLVSILNIQEGSMVGNFAAEDRAFCFFHFLFCFVLFSPCYLNTTFVDFVLYVRNLVSV